MARGIPPVTPRPAEWSECCYRYSSGYFFLSFCFFVDREGLQDVLAALNTDLATVVSGRASIRSRSEGARAFEDKGREVIKDILGKHSQDSFITAAEANGLWRICRKGSPVLIRRLSVH